MADTAQLNKLYKELTEELDEQGDLIWDDSWQRFEDEVVRLLGEDWRYERGTDVWEWTDEVWAELED